MFSKKTMEATSAQNAEGLAVIRVLAAVLDRLVSANVLLTRTDTGQVTKFHALKAPEISIYQYLERIHKYASCSPQCFILALIYIDRLISRNNFVLTDLNVHRVVITSVLLAAKFFDDAYYNNAYYAKVGGVLLSEMNGLEVEFLFRISFCLHVNPELYNKYHTELISHAVGIKANPSNNDMLKYIADQSYPSEANYDQLSTKEVLIPNTRITTPLQSEYPFLVNHTNGYCDAQPIDNSYAAIALPTQITPSPPSVAQTVGSIEPYACLPHYNVQSIAAASSGNWTPGDFQSKGATFDKVASYEGTNPRCTTQANYLFVPRKPFYNHEQYPLEPISSWVSHADIHRITGYPVHPNNNDYDYNVFAKVLLSELGTTSV